MNKLFQAVLCIKCQSTLVKKGKFFLCTKKVCSQKYPYVDGILTMLPKQSLKDRQTKYQQEYYDIEYKRYYSNQKFEFQKRYIKRLYKILPKKKSLVLDFACGPGYMTIAAAKAGNYVIACDISIVGLRYTYSVAKKLGIEKNILLIACDINKVSFKKKTFDFYIMTHVLEHFKNDYEIIQKLLITAKPYARFFISVPLSLKYVFYPLIPLYLYSDKQVGHLRRYTKESVINLFHVPVKSIATLYTGHLIKILGALLNTVGVHSFDKEVEDMDEKQLHNKIFGSVITLGLEIEK